MWSHCGLGGPASDAGHGSSRDVTRDPNDARAKDLASKGIEVISVYFHAPIFLPMIVMTNVEVT